jgi:chaperonin cofactor prefoldin
MRRFNLELNQAKLQTLNIQHSTLENQVKVLETKLVEVKARLTDKVEQIESVKNAIAAFQNSQTTSNA